MTSAPVGIYFYFFSLEWFLDSPLVFLEMEKLKTLVPNTLEQEIGVSTQSTLLSTASSLLDFFQNLPLFHQVIHKSYTVFLIPIHMYSLWMFIRCFLHWWHSCLFLIWDCISDYVLGLSIWLLCASPNIGSMYRLLELLLFLF